MSDRLSGQDFGTPGRAFIVQERPFKRADAESYKRSKNKKYRRKIEKQLASKQSMKSHVIPKK